MCDICEDKSPPALIRYVGEANLNIALAEGWTKITYGDTDMRPNLSGLIPMTKPHPYDNPSDTTHEV